MIEMIYANWHKCCGVKYCYTDSKTRQMSKAQWVQQIIVSSLLVSNTLLCPAMYSFKQNTVSTLAFILIQ
jgi:hypothetical protein